MNNWFTNTWEWFKSFFDGKTVASMMRLLNFLAVVNGLGVIWYCAIAESEYAHYGLELVMIGIFGKGYQDYNNYRRDKTKKDGENIQSDIS